MSNPIDMFKTLQIAAAGMRVKSQRLRVIGENIANANSTSSGAGGDPYRRKTISFQNVLDNSLGISTVRVAGFSSDGMDVPFSASCAPEWSSFELQT